MSALKSLAKDKVTLVKKDGSIVRENIQALVNTNLIIILSGDLPIETGDHLLRTRPGDIVDDYIVTDPSYHSTAGPLAAHFQVKVRPSDAPTGTQQAVVQNITNTFHGDNSRVNINSTDSSVNIVHSLSIEDVRGIVEQIRSNLGALPLPEREKITTQLDIIDAEAAQSAPSQPALRKALNSIRAISEGAGGNLVAAGIVQLIAHLLG